MTFMLMIFAIIGSLGFGQTHRCLTSGKTQIVDWVHSTFVLIFLQSIMPLVNGKCFRRYIYRTHYEDFDKFLALCNSAANTNPASLENTLCSTLTVSSIMGH
ncbi:hypothetical protein LPJ66_004268 [Kickxella alabastrina]|uniref:Uncharacterized protein n=1 Tax=Kickxella alabastrina TaxID=61397 RepID=A0ACC1IIE5_9FUNG|nr:hypothetical protein LPJ66_004268 [Kickxella alabastrina]